jgi:AcrR family transcriptional regulator
LFSTPTAAILAIVRKAGSNGAATTRAIREAAIRLIERHGFEATSLRMLADAVGIQAGSLYNHFASKEALLFDLLSGIMRELLDELDRRLAGLHDPVEQLEAFVSLHLEFHTRRKAEVFIGNMELRSLSPRRRRQVVALRDRYERRLREIVERGAAEGRFHAPDAALAASALIAMLTGPASWWRGGGRLDSAELKRRYRGFAFALLGADGARASPQAS